MHHQNSEFDLLVSCVSAPESWGKTLSGSRQAKEGTEDSSITYCKRIKNFICGLSFVGGAMIQLTPLLVLVFQILISSSISLAQTRLCPRDKSTALLQFRQAITVDACFPRMWRKRSDSFSKDGILEQEHRLLQVGWSDMWWSHGSRNPTGPELQPAPGSSGF